jgi:hypothetical protein
MTVAELIAQLTVLNHDALVLVEAYEVGLDSVDSLRSVEVMKCPQPQEWDGEFRESGKPGDGGLPGVLLVGRRGHRR